MTFKNSLCCLALLAVLLPVSASLGQQALGAKKAAKSDQSAAQSSPKVATPPVPAYHRSEKDAKPFPTLLPASQFAQNPIIARAYEIAHEIPGVLAQQPCYCYCDREFGHTSLLDCFTSTHTAGCMTCLKETYFTYQMTKQGKKPAAIRAAIMRGEWRNASLN